MIPRQKIKNEQQAARNGIWQKTIARQHPRDSIGYILEEAITQLRPITETPRIEAEVLLMHLLGTSHSAILTHPERRLNAQQAVDYRRLVAQRASGYPLPYITGHIEFYGLEIKVTPEVMIPRPETETLVDMALEHPPSTAVDVGIGSGCITVALATHLPDATFQGIDISPAALSVARWNLKQHGLEKRVRLRVGDVLTPRPSPVDLIISNPPYVSADEWASLPASVHYHEPQIALDGGPDGLTVIRELLAQAQGLLKPDGRLLIEIGASQGEAAMRLAQAYFPLATSRVHPDLAGRDRVLEIQT